MTYLMLGILLAEEPNRGPDYGKASPVGLLVVALLLVAVFFLVRSMNRQLKKVPASFDTPADAPASAGSAEAADVAAPDGEASPESTPRDPAP